VWDGRCWRSANDGRMNGHESGGSGVFQGQGHESRHSYPCKSFRQDLSSALLTIRSNKVTKSGRQTDGQVSFCEGVPCIYLVLDLILYVRSYAAFFCESLADILEFHIPFTAACTISRRPSHGHPTHPLRRAVIPNFGLSYDLGNQVDPSSACCKMLHQARWTFLRHADCR
jgi:hypothetical protein